MQYYLNGYYTGDPDLNPAAKDRAKGNQVEELPSECDVLIVGCGPAGLTLAAQLAAFPEIKTCIVDQKPGPLERGQADGVACRTMEMFNAFGFAERVLREAYWVNETSFWRSGENPEDGIERNGWVQDTEDGLSEQPHVILNQARVHEFYLDVMRKSASGVSPHYNRKMLDLSINTAQSENSAPAQFPVSVTFENQQDKRTETIRAKYVVGCDGARSSVRRALDLQLKGDSANTAWGVMDILAVTDFPDIRFKSIINSEEAGSIVLIPREGGYMVRIYVQMDKLEENERVASRNLDVSDIIAKAQRVFHPYTLDVKEVAWWSVYEIGQRLCDRFDDVPEADFGSRNPHVFIAGDACHTHSPKAGQGMNVSMQDAYNLGWKLASVLKGHSPTSLLATYSSERQAVAKELIDFDREFAAMLSGAGSTDDQGVVKKPSPEDVQKYFVKHGRYTAGTATHYAPSVLTSDAQHQDLAKGFKIGTRFHSAPVVRFADGKPMHLGHVHEADGRWRLFAFAGSNDTGDHGSDIAKLCQFLTESDASPIVQATPASSDIDAIIDVRAIFQQPHRELQHGQMPELLTPQKGEHGLRDYEKIFCASSEAGQDIFDLRDVDCTKGCIVVVRPDQYVATILPLLGFNELSEFFAPILTANPIKSGEF